MAVVVLVVVVVVVIEPYSVCLLLVFGGVLRGATCLVSGGVQ